MSEQNIAQRMLEVGLSCDISGQPCLSEAIGKMIAAIAELDARLAKVENQQKIITSWLGGNIAERSVMSQTTILNGKKISQTVIVSGKEIHIPDGYEVAKGSLRPNDKYLNMRDSNSEKIEWLACYPVPNDLYSNIDMYALVIRPIGVSQGDSQ